MGVNICILQVILHLLIKVNKIIKFILRVYELLPMGFLGGLQYQEWIFSWGMGLKSNYRVFSYSPK